MIIGVSPIPHLTIMGWAGFVTSAGRLVGLLLDILPPGPSASEAIRAVLVLRARLLVITGVLLVLGVLN
jgi:hypothetical protein